MSPSEAAKLQILERLRSVLARLLKARPSADVDRVPLVEMGVNSLTMMELVRTVDRELGVKVQVRQLFRDLSTLEALAEHVAEQGSVPGVEAPASVPAPPQGGAPPDPAGTRLPGLPPPEIPGVDLSPAASAPPGLEGLLKGQIESVAHALNRVVATQLQTLAGMGMVADTKGAGRVPDAGLDASATSPAVQEESAPGQGRASPSGVPACAPPASLPPWKPAESRAGEMEERQGRYLEEFTRRYCRRTPGSKEWARRHRAVLADNRASAGFRFTTKELLYPIVGTRGEGSHIWDLDGNEYLDLTMGFGVHLFGHHPPFLMEAMEEQLRRGIQLGPQAELAGEVAGAICALTGMERAAFCNTGTEAVMTALRLARAATGRPTVALFTGSYHGHFDGTLGVPGAPGDPRAIAAVPGTTDGMVGDVLVLDYGDPRSLEILASRAGELAAVLVEPVQSRHPELQPRDFLHDLASLTRDRGIALIFDEMITGFRTHTGGAQAWFGVKADMGVYGKVIGGGLPIGVVAGRSAYLDALDGGMWDYGDESYPAAETTFFAGTFNKHPLTLAAARAVLHRLYEEGPGLQEGLNRRTTELAGRLNALFREEKAPVQVAHFGSLFRLRFTGNLDLLFYHLLDRGIYVWEGRNCFLSTAHTDEDLDHLVDVVGESIQDLRGGGFIAGGLEEPTSPPMEGCAPAAVGEPSTFPLSEAQQQVWVQAEMSPAGSLAYNITTSLHLEGDLREELLEEALRRLVVRHEALRLTVDGNGETQTIREGPVGAILERVAPGWDEEDPEPALRRWLGEVEAERLFDLSTGPLHRFTLLNVSATHQVLVLTVHHIALDGWSIGILIRELAELYNALVDGVPWEPEPALSYRDYLSYREALSLAPEMRAHEAFWMGVFEDLPEPLELPGDRPHPPRRSFSSLRRTVTLPPALARRVVEVGSRAGTTPFMTMLAAYVALLGRVGRNQDLSVGIPVSARSPEEAWNLVGYCTNVLPLRCHLDGSPAFGELMDQVRDRWLEAVDHVDLPLSGLIRRLDIPYDPSVQPLVSVLFNLDQASSGPELEGLRTRWASSPIRYAVFDLFLNVIQHGDRFTLECDANADLFDANTVDRILGMYLRLLEAGLDDPREAVSRLPLLTGSQRRALEEWNDTREEPGDELLCVHDLFARTARRVPEAVAVSDGENRMTYARLDELADGLAARLRSRGVGPDTVVGICMPRSPEMVVSILAVLKAGGAYLPLDPAHPTERLRHMLTTSRVPLVLAREEALGRIPETGAEVVPYPVEENREEGVEGVETRPEHLAYVMYTSGSTGRPKGAMVEHRNLVNLVLGLRRRIYDRYRGTLRVGLVASSLFDASVQQIFGALLLGHELWIVPDPVRDDGVRLAAFLRENRIDLVDGTPTHLRMLVEAAGAGDKGLGPRHLIIGGEEMPATTLRELFRGFPESPPRITNIYGVTECCVDSLAFDLTSESVEELDRVPIGTPMANQRVHILDDGMQPMPVGTVGEIWIGGDSVGRGYHHNDALTAERFFEGIHGDPGRLYRTGDLGRWRSDGTIDFLGRIDHLVKVRGFRVELGEIENALLDFKGAALPVLGSGSAWSDRAGVPRCVRCVLPADYPGLSFDEEGVCSVCREYEGYRGAADAYFGEAADFRAALDPVLETSRGEHDCMLLYSGGKDSSYVLYRLLDMGLKVLTFTFDNGHISERALESIRRTTTRLGIESIIASFQDMEACFAESLSTDNTVCTGCFRALTALSTREAWEREIDVIVTGLSRGQILDTKLSGLLKQGLRDPEEMEGRLTTHRRMYHRRSDAISRILDIQLDDDRFERTLFADYFRFDPATESQILSYLGEKDPAWTQPGDTGFCSSNCLINDVGISVHLANRGYHNYAAPMSWECRLGLRSREDALTSLRLDSDQDRITETLASVYANASPVQSAVVIPRTDPSGHKTLCAYLVTDRKVSVEALRRHLAQRLPDYMIPSQIVMLDRMPMTASGKVDRAALPKPEALREMDETRGAPRTPTEELVAGIWCEVLGVEVVGREDSFFDLGGHSISAIQVVARIRDLFRLDLPTRSVFEHPVLAELCATVDAMRRTGEAVAPPPLRRRSVSGEAPLSFSQQRLWFLDQLEGESAAYNVPGALRIRGPLDPSALEEAILRIVERHETLRTTFKERDGGPVQVIQPQGTVALEQVDLSELSEEERGEEVRRRAARVATVPFDLGGAPLLRLELLHLGPREFVLLTAMHHIVSDGWSFGVFARELAAFYGTSSHVLPELGIQYADWAHWERDWFSDGNLEPRIAWWKERLAGAPALLSLPTDRPRPPVQSFRGATHHTTIEAGLAGPLRVLGEEVGATLFMSLLGVFVTLLHRYTHETDIVVGTPVANRIRREVEPLIGFFVNTLALRVGVRGEEGFDELLRRVREVSLDAFAQHDTPFDRVVDELDVERSLSHQPLFQVMFILQNTPMGALSIPGLELEPMELDTPTAKFDLTLALREEQDGALAAEWEYNTDLFDPETIARMAEHFCALLASVAVAPDRPVGLLPMLSKEERSSLLQELNRTEVPIPELPLHGLFEEQVDEHPHGVALAWAGGALTYGQLEERANRMANLLADKGIGPGDAVGVYLDRSPELVAALMAVLKAGAAYVPMDPAFPRSRLAEILTDSGAGTVIAVEGEGSAWMAEELGLLLLDPGSTAGASASRPEVGGSQEDLAYLIYTSGSTGRPKGVEVTHRSLVNFLVAMDRELHPTEEDILLAVTTISFDIAALELFLPLVRGAAVHLAGAEDVRDGHRLAALIDTAGPTLMQATPATWRMLLAAGWKGRGEMTLLCGGEALPGGLAKELRSLGRAVVNLYGPTETTIWSSLYRVEEASGEEGLPEPIGRPIANTRMYVLDPQTLNPVPVGVAGELCIGGAGVARGYRGRPELTRERFLADPFQEDAKERIYRTGDLARYRPDGIIEFLGRMDHQLKLRGFRIEAGEVEAALLEHPAVGSAVVGIRGETLDERRLIAWIVPRMEEQRSAGLSGDQLHQWQQVWDEVYAEGPEASDATFDISGWHDSVRGEPIPAEEMREWAETTAQRLKVLAPRRVLEIGCGTGLIAARLAPHCQEYMATDFSPAAVKDVTRMAQEVPGLTHLRVEERAAHDLGTLEAGHFDLVILNSVVQYFPGEEYLLGVLEEASRVVRPGGRIFLGDLRDLRLLEAFHATVQLEAVPEEVETPGLARIVANRLEEEEELLIGPAFLSALPERVSGVSGVGVLLRRGSFDNELNRYRFDALLDIGEEGRRGVEGQVDMEWVEVDGLEGFSRYLKSEAPHALALRQVPNARLGRGERVLSLLRDGTRTVAELRRMLEGTPSPGVDPESFWALGEEQGYDVAVSWAASGDPTHLDVFFRRSNGGPPDPWRSLPGAVYPIPTAGNGVRTNDPLRGKLARRLVPELRQHLEERLPDYMVPSAFMMLQELPLTPNRKVDRKALPAPELVRLPSGQGYKAPSGPTQSRLAEIFARVLGVPRVGVRDGFFELGGHSLLATQVVSRIRDEMGLTIPVRRIFEAPTVEEMARYLDALQVAATRMRSQDGDDEAREEGVM